MAAQLGKMGELQKSSQQNVVPDHHGHLVCKYECMYYGWQRRILFSEFKLSTQVYVFRCPCPTSDNLRILEENVGTALF